MTYPWFNLAVALTLGLLIGLERERSKGEGPARRPVGIRTFALAALVGAIAVQLGGILLLAIATAGVAVLTALSYVRGHDPDPGLTTEIGLMSAPLIGGLAMSDTLLVSALGLTAGGVVAAIRHYTLSEAEPPARRSSMSPPNAGSCGPCCARSSGRARSP